MPRPTAALLLQVLATLCTSLAHGLKITKIEVPRYLVVGQKATLQCQYTLEGDVLYSLKWWKDSKQFYQYIPKSDPAIVVFTVPGISVNPQTSGHTQVELMDVQTSSSGTYRCEVVAEGPTFATHVLSSNMTIVDTPDSRPVITGLETSYREGDRISINCTSHRSRPPAVVMWKLQNSTIVEDSTLLDEYLVSYPPVVEDDPPLYTSTLGLQLTARRTLFTKGLLRLRCTATVHTYEWKTDVDLHLDHVTYTQPHHLPTQLNTGSSSGGPHVCSSLLSLLLLISIINLRSSRLLH